MAFLYQKIDVHGRLKNISHQPLAKDFQGDQVAGIHLLRLPDDQDGDAQLGFITSQLPTFVAGFGGCYDDGSQWIVTFERAPALAGTRREGVRTLRRHLARVIEVDPTIEVAQELVLSRQQLRAVYPRWTGGRRSRQERAEGTRAMIDPDSLGVTDLLRGIASQACGYSLSTLCRTYPTGCAFPDGEHTCTGEFFGDVFQAWNDQSIAPGDDTDA